MSWKEIQESQEKYKKLNMGRIQPGPHVWSQCRAAGRSLLSGTLCSDLEQPEVGKGPGPFAS